MCGGFYRANRSCLVDLLGRPAARPGDAKARVSVDERMGKSSGAGGPSGRIELGSRPRRNNEELIIVVIAVFVLPMLDARMLRPDFAR